MRFSLRLAPDEMAICEDVQDRIGGPALISLNTVIALLIIEGYHYRVAAQGWETLPLSPETWGYVSDTADELGIPSHEALELLVRRGAPHQPQRACMTPSPTFHGVGLADRLSMHPQGRMESPNGPRYATPRPSGLPPVPPVTGQVPYDHDDQDDQEQGEQR